MFGNSIRLEDNSLLLYIKHTILRYTVEFTSKESLLFLPDVSTETQYIYKITNALSPGPTDKGRGLLYFERTNIDGVVFPYTSIEGTNALGDLCVGSPEQISTINVFEFDGSEFTLVNYNEYYIDYNNGVVISDRELNSPHWSYYWNFVSVLDDWPDSQEEVPPAPLIIVDINKTTKQGYQLGGGKKTIRNVFLHVFSESSAQRDSILEVLYDGLYLKSNPIYQLPTGNPLDFDGTFYGRHSTRSREDTLFDRTSQLKNSTTYFEEVISKNYDYSDSIGGTSYENLVKDLNKYRSMVKFDLVSYDDRTI